MDPLGTEILDVLSRRRTLLLGLFTFILFAAAINRFFYFEGGDNAHYLMLARALVHGQGYTDTHTFPAEPHTQYPPLFPLLLASVMAGFGENLLLLKGLLALLAAIAVVAAHRLWETRDGAGPALAASLLAATVPFTLKISLLLLAGIPLAAWVALSLWFAERARGRDSLLSPAPLLCVCFALCALSTRITGLALLPALVAAALLQPPLRLRLRHNLARAAFYGLPLLAATSAWYLRAYRVTQGQAKYYQLKEFWLQNPANLESARMGFAEFAGRVGQNGVYYLERIGRNLWPFASYFGSDHAVWLGLLLVLVALPALIRELRQQRGAPEFYSLVLAGLLLAWGHRDERFLIPLYPLFLFYLVQGAQALMQWAAARAFPNRRIALSRFVLGLLLATMLSSNLDADIELLAAVHRDRSLQGFEINPRFHLIANTPDHDAMLALALYLRAHSSAEDVVLARKPNLVALASRRQTVPIPFTTGPADALAYLEEKRVRYIVVDEAFPEAGAFIAPLLLAHPDRFRLVYQVPGRQSRLYQVRPGP